MASAENRSQSIFTWRDFLAAYTISVASPLARAGPRRLRSFLGGDTHVCPLLATHCLYARRAPGGHRRHRGAHFDPVAVIEQGTRSRESGSLPEQPAPSAHRVGELRGGVPGS